MPVHIVRIVFASTRVEEHHALLMPFASAAVQPHVVVVAVVGTVPNIAFHPL